MYSFICICEYCRVQGRMIYEMVIPADPSAALASSNNPKFFIHPQILLSTCRSLASSVSRSKPQHARDSRNAESSLSIPALCTLVFSFSPSESTGELIGSWLEAGMKIQGWMGPGKEGFGTPAWMSSKARLPVRHSNARELLMMLCSKFTL